MKRDDQEQHHDDEASGGSDPQRTDGDAGDRQSFVSMLDPTNQLLTLRCLLPEEPERKLEEPDVDEAA